MPLPTPRPRGPTSASSMPSSWHWPPPCPAVPGGRCSRCGPCRRSWRSTWACAPGCPSAQGSELPRTPGSQWCCPALGVGAVRLPSAPHPVSGSTGGNSIPGHPPWSSGLGLPGACMCLCICARGVFYPRIHSQSPWSPSPTCPSRLSSMVPSSRKPSISHHFSHNDRPLPLLTLPAVVLVAKTVNPKGNQPWIFIGRTDAEAEAPRLWPPNVKN